MTTKAHLNRIGKPVKFGTRLIRRCELCGRARGVYRKFRICRICLRNLAHQGKIPGLMKASW